MEQWLPLAEFAHKNNISTSTLRRRIRSNRIAFRLESGKYLIRENAHLVPYERDARDVRESRSFLKPSRVLQDAVFEDNEDNKDNKDNIGTSQSFSQPVSRANAPAGAVSERRFSTTTLTGAESAVARPAKSQKPSERGEMFSFMEKILGDINGKNELILRDKDALIFDLREEIADLKTLVKAYESKLRRR